MLINYNDKILAGIKVAMPRLSKEKDIAKLKRNKSKSSGFWWEQPQLNASISFRHFVNEILLIVESDSRITLNLNEGLPDIESNQIESELNRLRAIDCHITTIFNLKYDNRWFFAVNLSTKCYFRVDDDSDICNQNKCERVSATSGEILLESLNYYNMNYYINELEVKG